MRTKVAFTVKAPPQCGALTVYGLSVSFIDTSPFGGYVHIDRKNPLRGLELF